MDEKTFKKLKAFCDKHDIDYEISIVEPQYQTELHFHIGDECNFDSRTEARKMLE